ncbi:MAG: hypothetical protein NXI31_18865 [bacterium]|nr:hypothetical protein [bacterium]
MVMLLRARGSGRGRGRGKQKGGVLGAIAGFGDGLVRLITGKKASKDPGPRRGAGAMAPAWALLAVALLCFSGGYVVRGYVAPNPEDAGGAGLKSQPRSPGLLEADTTALHNHAFFVSAYEDLQPEEARGRAIALSRYLQDMGLQKARAYEFQAAQGPLWVTVVYYDGPAEMAATEKQLHGLPADVPDPIFVGLRNHETGWPIAGPIQ